MCLERVACNREAVPRTVDSGGVARTCRRPERAVQFLWEGFCMLSAPQVHTTEDFTMSYRTSASWFGPAVVCATLLLRPSAACAEPIAFRFTAVVDYVFDPPVN